MVTDAILHGQNDCIGDQRKDGGKCAPRQHAREVHKFDDVPRDTADESTFWAGTGGIFVVGKDLVDGRCDGFELCGVIDRHIELSDQPTRSASSCDFLQEGEMDPDDVAVLWVIGLQNARDVDRDTRCAEAITSLDASPCRECLSDNGRVSSGLPVRDRTVPYLAIDCECQVISGNTSKRDYIERCPAVGHVNLHWHDRLHPVEPFNAITVELREAA